MTADIDKLFAEWDRLGNPSVFTNALVVPPTGGYYVYPGSKRFEKYLRAYEEQNRDPFLVAETSGVRFEVNPRSKKAINQAKLALGKDTPLSDLIFFEARGYIFLPWVVDFLRDPRGEKTVIGLTGTGKTAGIGMACMVYCARHEGFNFLNVAPWIYQSNLMVRAIEQEIKDTEFLRTFLAAGKKGHGYAKEKPYTTYAFPNGSMAEFMNVQRHAANIQSWSGDWINVDEAGLLWNTDESGATQLSGIMGGLASRMRATRANGIPRLGWLSLISLGYDNETLWERYDYGIDEATAKDYYSRLVLHRDNPYLRPEDIERIVRNVPDWQKPMYLKGERPPRPGAYFHPSVLQKLYSEQQMNAAVARGDTFIQRDKCGIIEYAEAPVQGHVYCMAGDPGTGEYPNRNAPVITIFDMTEFPATKAKLVGFWWGFGNGSYRPFIYKFQEWTGKYHVPTMFRGYDSTSNQKALAELAFETGEDQVTPLGFESGKKWQYLTALLLLAGADKLQIPAGITGLEHQMKGYVLPDKKITQDIVSTLAMAAFLMVPLYHMEMADNAMESDSADAGGLFAQDGRYGRPFTSRGAARATALEGDSVRYQIPPKSKEA